MSTFLSSTICDPPVKPLRSGGFSPLRWTFRRSAGKPRSLRRKLIVRSTLAIVLLCVTLAVGRYHHLKRHQEVHPGMLHRTGQPTELGIWYLVRVKGVKTVLSTQLYDMRLRRGLIDPGEPSGERESAYVRQLGAQPRQWPMGKEACWPWLTPWQFEQFFKLFDDPDNLPVAVHCAGGRHRTGTVAALFRLEYDRWSPEQALRELHSFEFGRAVAVQEHNLRTYLPRPWPSQTEWQTLCGELANKLPGQPARDYEELVRRLRADLSSPEVQSAVREYLAGGRPFSICLAQRLVEEPGDPLCAPAASLADQVMGDDPAQPHDWSMAAALIADFGSAEQQRRLLALIESEPRTSPPTARYQAIVAGVTNRYTPNRIPYLRPLLDDQRPRPAAAAARYRYCDTAVVHLSSTIDQNLLVSPQGLEDWEGGRRRARDWFDARRDHLPLTQLRPAMGDNPVLPGDPPGDGELVRN
jgi:hypothetical protein